MTNISPLGSMTPMSSLRTGNESDDNRVSVKDNTVTVKGNEAISWLGQTEDQGVTLELSTDQQQGSEENQKSIQEQYQEQLKDAKESAKAAGEEAKNMGRALEIARRLMHGDKVPSTDEKFLMDFNRDIYISAKSMQAMAQNQHPKDYDTILGEEEQEDDTEQVSSDGMITVDASQLNILNQ